MAQPQKKNRQFTKRSTALQVVNGLDLSGKTYVITGGNSGIGFEAARALATRNAHVVLACRDSQKTRDARSRILKEKSDAKVDVLHVDFANLKSVQDFAENFKEKGWKLDCLILNAGVYTPDPRVTADGFEATFQVNHLSQYHLTKLLLQQLVQSAPARVVVVSSEAHRQRLCHKFRPQDVKWEVLSPTNKNKLNSAYRAYSLSKICNVLFANELNRQYHGEGVTANSLHPGLVRTDLGRNSRAFTGCLHCCFGSCAQNTEEGAATIVYCATAPELDGVGGQYFQNCKSIPMDPCARNEDTARKLWDLSDEMIKEHHLRDVARHLYNRQRFFKTFTQALTTSDDQRNAAQSTVDKFIGQKFYQMAIKTGLATGISRDRFVAMVKQWQGANLLSDAQKNDLLTQTEALTQCVRDSLHGKGRGKGVYGLVGVLKEDDTLCMAYVFTEFKFLPKDVKVVYSAPKKDEDDEATEPLIGGTRIVGEGDKEIPEEEMGHILAFVRWKTLQRFESANGPTIRRLNAESDQYIQRLPESIRNDFPPLQK